MTTKERAKKSPRKKRSVGETRSAILDAAVTHFSDWGPDTVDLDDIAISAGVTRRALDEQFGSRQALVGAVILRHRELYAQRAAEVVRGPDFVPGTGEALEVLIDLLADPQHARLVAWSLLQGARDISLFDSNRMRSLLDLAATTGASRLGLPADVLRGEAEGLVAMVSYAAFGFALAGDAVAEAFGRSPSPEDAAAFRRRLRVMIQGYLAFAGPRALPMS